MSASEVADSVGVEVETLGVGLAAGISLDLHDATAIAIRQSVSDSTTG